MTIDELADSQARWLVLGEVVRNLTPAETGPGAPAVVIALARELVRTARKLCADAVSTCERSREISAAFRKLTGRA